VRRGLVFDTFNSESETLRYSVASAAFEVGYESASQFNREYSRFFGQPPMRDIRNLRAVGSISTDVS
jgi:AraC-like DNA-binding protein